VLIVVLSVVACAILGGWLTMVVADLYWSHANPGSSLAGERALARTFFTLFFVAGGAVTGAVIAILGAMYVLSRRR
jgi:hypothetical protein